MRSSKENDSWKRLEEQTEECLVARESRFSGLGGKTARGKDHAPF